MLFKDSVKISRTKVLEKRAQSSWMDTMTLNPAIMEKDGIIHMLFRATGTFVSKHQKSPDEFPICLGYGKSRDGGENWEFNFKRPALVPSLKYEKEDMYIINKYGERKINYANGCIEDPRLFMLEDKCYMTAACRMFPPGAYWVHDEPMQCAPEWAREETGFGRASSENVTVTVLYEVDFEALEKQDFSNAFSYITNLTNPEFGQNRDVILFPEKMMIDGEMQYVMLERPVTPYLNPQMAEKKPSMVISAAKSLSDFADKDNKKTIFAVPEYEWEQDRIGASTPLVKLDGGRWLLCYHGKQDDTYGYTQSFMILENRENTFPEIVFRSGEKFINVSEKWEMPQTFKTPCIFATGMIKRGEKLLISYGAADECVGVMTLELNDLLSYIENVRGQYF